MVPRGVRLLLVVVAAVAVLAEVAEAQNARLTLTSVLGRAPGGLTLPFGIVDFDCVNPPATGVTCVSASGASATWHGGIGFRVALSGPGAAAIRLRLMAVRQAGGTMPAGALLDGPSGAIPATAYSVQPSTPITLVSSIGSGNTNVARSIGLRVTPADASGPWTSGVIYSLVVE